MIVRFLDFTDLDAILAIERSSPEVAHWSRADYERACVERGRTPPGREWLGWVAERSGKIVGFIVTRQVADQVEVLNLAVEPESRREGVGSVLLGEALAFAREAGVPRGFLEVRESNAGAIAFYARHGFAVSGRRRGYYLAPVEDALVLSRSLLDAELDAGR